MTTFSQDHHHLPVTLPINETQILVHPTSQLSYQLHPPLSVPSLVGHPPALLHPSSPSSSYFTLKLENLL